MSLTPLNALLGQKAWADRELFARLATLSADQADTLQACVRTLNHIHIVDRLFRARLAGEPEPFEATQTAPLPTLEALRAAVEETDAWYLAELARCDEAALGERLAFRFTDGDAGCMTREEMLLHVVLHGSYHRGNVGQLLKGIGVSPPRDLLTKFLHQSEPARRGG